MKNSNVRSMCVSDISNVIKYDMTILGETLGEETIKSHLQSNLMRYLVMEDERSEFMGMMSLWIDLDKAQINNFYIIEKYQSLGYGKQFMDYAMNYLLQNQVKEITLEVRASNERAISLYESYGYHQVSIRKNYYKNGEDALLMYLRIGSD